MSDVWTETAIRNYLDGYFVKVMPNGRIKEIDLEERELARNRVGDARLPSHRKDWTTTELHTVIGMLHRGRTISECAERLGRTYNAVKQRIIKLRKQGAAI